MDTFLEILAIVVFPLLLTKTTERGRFDWVHRYLREGWTFVLLAYTLGKVHGEVMHHIHSRLGTAYPRGSYFIVGALGFFVACAYWGITGWVLDRAEPEDPPLTKSDSFGTLIPIIPTNQNVPIPLDTAANDPHSDFYRDLLMLSGRSEKPPAGAPAYADRNLLTDNGMSFAVRVLHYYAFYSIYRLQRGSVGGISWKLGQGIRPINKVPIPPPDATPYPNDTLLKLLSGSEFLREGDKLLWRFDNNRLVVPKGTDVSFAEIPGNPEKGQMMVCRIRFARPHYYTVDFDISPGMAQLHQMPAGFEPQQIQGVFTWNIQVAMHYQIEKRTDDGFRADQYSAWADALFDGLKKNMEF